MQSTAHNSTECDNVLIPVSSFKGGGVWSTAVSGCVQMDENGPRGGILDITRPYVRLQAKLPHATLSWEGERLLLVGFHIRSHLSLSAEDRRVLEGLGFNLLPCKCQSRPRPRV